ncbi:hypothetical protein CPB84DRAFT_1849988 [Gymnopilus junonius]|uniref:Uncharacterized protein n=1 Tax=Gymnopilus junonius TaxID=109634 RepID=A0A9P5NF57_GYMJU|nr:hypothetical protein CPB84DRAFT_1849988 [Gymnopilus junonius]
MAGPQDNFSIQSPSQGPVRDHPLVDNREGAVLASPSRAILPSHRVGQSISFDIGAAGLPNSRTTLDSNFSFTPSTRHTSAPSYFYSWDPGRTTGGSTSGRAESQNAGKWLNARQFAWAAVCMLYTLGVYRLFSAKFKFKERSELSSGIIADSSYAQWVKTVRRMCGIWRLARVGCGLLLPLSIALLQIDGVIDTVFTRTCTITTAICAACGLLSSGIYLFLKSEFKSQRTRIKWVEASNRSTALESIEFWTLLSLPLASFLWAILSCALTVVCIAWTKQNSVVIESDVSFIASAVFITVLAVITLIHLYKAAQLLEWI